MDTHAPGSRVPQIAALPAVLLVAVAAWEIVASVRAARSVPPDAAWARAAEIVRAGHRPGDLIVFAPAWTDPVGRMHLGDLIPIEMAARMDAARYPRIWELAIRGARAPDTAGLAPVASQDAGGVVVRRYERAPVGVLADVRDALASARVTGGGARVELAEVGFAPHRCVLVVPSPGAPLQVTFPQLPLGRELVGHVGIADVFTRRDERSPGQLELAIDGHRIKTIAVGVDDGWLRFRATTRPGPADVTFIATATRSGKQICFAAEAQR